MPPATDVVILSAVRTAIGKFQGGLSAIPAPQLGALAIQAAMDRAGVDASAVAEVIMGNVVIRRRRASACPPGRYRRRTTRRSRRGDDQQGLRIGSEGCDARRVGHPQQEMGTSTWLAAWRT